MRWANAILLILVLFGSALLFSYYEGDFFSDSDGNTTLENAPTVIIEGIPVKVVVADTPQERSRGLSGRSALQANEGMLFVFENEEIPGFWMKDMLFSIDIIWISAQGEVVGVEKSVSPESYPAAFRPQEPVKYVLEASAGFSDRNGVKRGSKIDLEMVY